MECKLSALLNKFFILSRMDKMDYKFILIIKCLIKIMNSLPTLVL